MAHSYNSTRSSMTLRTVLELHRLSIYQENAIDVYITKTLLCRGATVKRTQQNRWKCSLSIITFLPIGGRYRCIPKLKFILSFLARLSPTPSRDLCLGALGVLLLLFCSLDVWYFLRVAWAVIGAWFQKPVWDVLGEQSVPGRVLLQDIDMGHMNNARYLRECDFARFSLYSRNGVFKACRALRATLVVGATTIRLRRALFLGEAFELRTRIVVWDEKAFYLEQRFVSCRDGLVAAVMFCKQNVIRSSPEKILQYLCKRKVECPDYPEELQHWISFISASSQALRAQSGLKDTTTESSQANVEEQENAGEQEHLKDKDK